MSDDWVTDDFPAPSDAAYDGFDDWSSDGVDGSKVGSGRVEVDKPGYYHFSIKATAKPSPYNNGRDGQPDYEKPRRPSILLECVVLDSVANLSPAGAVLYHELIMGGKGPGAPIEAWAKEQTLNFLVGVGICQTRGGEVIDPETGTTRLNSGTLVKRLDGLQFIGHVKVEKGGPKKDASGNQMADKNGSPLFYDDSIGFPFGRGAFAIDDPRVSHVPKDVESLRAIGKEHLATVGSKPPSPPPAPKQGEPAKQPAPKKPDLPDDM